MIVAERSFHAEERHSREYAADTGGETYDSVEFWRNRFTLTVTRTRKQTTLICLPSSAINTEQSVNSAYKDSDCQKLRDWGQNTDFSDKVANHCIRVQRVEVKIVVF